MNKKDKFVLQFFINSKFLFKVIYNVTEKLYKIYIMAMKKKFRIRMLPLIMFVAFLMLTFRISSIYNGFIKQSTADASRVRIASEQEISQEFQIAMATENKVEPAPKLTDNITIRPSKNIDTEEENSTYSGKFEINSSSITFGDPANTNSDTPTFSQSELEVLQKLAFRREQLENQEQEITKKFAILEASQAQIDKKIIKLKNLQQIINGLLIKHSEEEQQRLNAIAKMYASMKPKSAAKIFDQLDLETLMTVVENMKASQSGLIVSQMNPIKAKELTTSLAERRTLPRPEKMTNLVAQ
ncbi:MAG: hypothetical protein GY804_05950 [Alphaproteobacteria bacterium]|nr:hypothetical protein [Alphaproteobacteria bacterium]